MRLCVWDSARWDLRKGNVREYSGALREGEFEARQVMQEKKDIHTW
jgi:hypothetical protein